MAETTARQFLFAFLIFGAVLTAGFTLIGMALPEDNSNFNKFNASFNKFEDIKSTAEESSDQVASAKPSSGLLGILNGLIESSWGAIKLIFKSTTLMDTLLTDMSDSFGIPTWFTGLMIAIIGITMGFALMAAWFKWQI